MLPMLLAHVAAAADGVPTDVKYIRCGVCESLAAEVHSHVQKTPDVRKSEASIVTALEQSCDPTSDAGAWMRSIDLVELEGRLVLVRQEEDGPCNRECATIKLACRALLEEGWETELGEALYGGVDAKQLRNDMCTDWSSACRKPPPKLDAARQPGPPFRAYTDEERALRDQRSGAPPPPGMLTEAALRKRLAVNAHVAVSSVAAAEADDFDPWMVFVALVQGMASRKPRLLCLHGKDSNAEATAMQMMLLGLHDFDASDAPCECVFAEGPHEAGKFDAALSTAGRAWHAEGQPLEVGLKAVAEYVHRQGPFDGAYAFSQGASMLAMLSDPAVWRAHGGSDEAPPWRYVIIGCGVDHLLSHADAPTLELPLALPSLHIIGQRDEHRVASRSLAERFAAPAVVLEHEEGHSIPLALCDGGAAHDALLKQVQQFARQTLCT